jgi:hypothetical protein
LFSSLRLPATRRPAAPPQSAPSPFRFKTATATPSRTPAPRSP